jgi:hypothetical protein
MVSDCFLGWVAPAACCVRVSKQSMYGVRSNLSSRERRSSRATTPQLTETAQNEISDTVIWFNSEIIFDVRSRSAA